jgi:hypothetical protein
VEDHIWRKSSRSQATHCVEWRKSSRSGAANCLEHCTCQSDTVQIRNSKNPDAGTTTISVAAWSDFIDGVKNNEFAI